MDTIYVCTDSGREGEYIYRLVRQEAHVTGKSRKRSMDRLTDRGRDYKRNKERKGYIRIR